MQIRTLRSDEREGLLELLDRWGVPDGWRGRDFFRRYLELDPTYEDRNVWVADQDGELISCVQIFPRRLGVLGHAVPTGGIGSVFTDPGSRKRGVAAALLDRAVQAMVERGFELSILFAGRIAWYTRLGWRSWPCQRVVVRAEEAEAPPDADGELELLPFEADGELELRPFEADGDFDPVHAIHSAYSGARTGTVVRDAAQWTSSFRLAGNPAEEFWVACRRGEVVAYARATLLSSVFQVTELGRRGDAADALAELVAQMLKPRENDILATQDKASRELRGFAVLPAFADIPLGAALERRRISAKSMADPSTMLRCLDAEALASRLSVSLLPGEAAGDFLTRVVPQELVFWPADRF